MRNDHIETAKLITIFNITKHKLKKKRTFFKKMSVDTASAAPLYYKYAISMHISIGAPGYGNIRHPGQITRG